MTYTNRQWDTQDQQPVNQQETNQLAQNYRTEIEWARTHLSIGATAIDLGQQLGLTDGATEELAKSLMNKAFASETDDVKHFVNKLWRAITLYAGDPKEQIYETKIVPGCEENVVNLEEYKKEHKIYTSRIDRKIKDRLDTKHDIDFSFVAPSPGMSVDEIMDIFLPEDVSDRTLFILGVCDQISSIIENNSDWKDDDNLNIHNLASRAMSLMVQVSNFFKSNNIDDPKAIRAISLTLGKYMQTKKNYIRMIAKTLGAKDMFLTFEDLIAEGEIGLIESLGKFDLGVEDIKFLGFAWMRIHGSMVDAIRNQSHVIKPSRGDVKKFRVHNELVSQGKSIEEVAEFLGTDPESLKKSLTRYNDAMALSIDSRVEDITSKSRGEGLSFADTIIDKSQDVEELALGGLAKMINLSEIVSKLPERRCDVIRMKFGLEPYDDPISHVEIAEKYGVTQSRISQIVQESLKQLQTMLPQYM